MPQFFIILKMASNKIRKSDLVESIYQKTDFEKQTIQAILDSFLLTAKNYLKEGATIELRGFGTFETKLRSGREKARNPKTGEAVSIPPHHAVIFRAGQDLRDAVYNLPLGGLEEDA